MDGIDYREIFDSVDDALLVVDADSGRIRDMNRQCRSLLGIDASASDDLHLRELFADADSSPQILAVVSDRDDSEPAVVRRNLDVEGKTSLPAEVRFSSLRGDKVLVTVRELVASEDRSTETAQAERALTELVEYTPDVMWMFSADWEEYVFVNSAYEDVFGHSLDDLKENPANFLEGVHPEDRDDVQAAMERLSSGKEIDIEYRVDPRVDFERHVWVSGVPIRDETGEVYRVAGFVRDISERRERKQELLRRRNLIENVPIGVFRVSFDDEQTLTQVNPALVSMLDADDEATLLGRTVQQFFVDTEAASRLVDELREQETVTFETRFETLDGAVFWGRLTALIQTDDAGQRVIDGVVEDITTRKRRQRQLRVVDRILRHNIRNDISVISGYASYIGQNGDRPDEEAINSILARSRKLLRTAEKGHAAVEVLSESAATTTFDLVPDVEHTVEGLRDLYPDATIRTDLPEEARVEGLQDIDLALHELLENSVVHHEDTPTVEVSVATTDDAVRITISDDGPGIPEREYEILSGTADPDPLSHGSGMGLWLVYWIVRLSGGDISFASSETGSAVTVELPAATNASVTNDPDTASPSG